MSPGLVPIPDPEVTTSVRTVWISDLHLGTPGCQAGPLLDFLRQYECRTLYLVGDIIDGWQLRRSWYWPQAHNDVVQKSCARPAKAPAWCSSRVITTNSLAAMSNITSVASMFTKTAFTPRLTDVVYGSRTAICSMA